MTEATLKPNDATPPSQASSARLPQTWWVYLLACRDGRTYAGVALDVQARFALHCTGKAAKFTRANPPLKVLGMRAFASKSDALKAEAALKRLAKPAKLAWAQSNPADIAVTLTR